LEKKEILSNYSINPTEESLLISFIQDLNENNKHINLVGKSTLINAWKSHILDSLQIAPLIKEKKLNVLDMGAGAGLPGVILSIVGFKNITLVDSNGKKTRFLESFRDKHSLDYTVIRERLETIDYLKFDIVVCRALANLNKLFSYSQNFIKKNTVLIFLKGKTVNEEIETAKKNWNFKFEKKQSFSDSRGSILVIKELKKND